MRTKPDVLTALRWIVPLLLLIWSVWFMRQPHYVEQWYAQSWYPPLARFLRTCTAIVPFSLGDSLVLMLACWLLWRGIAWCRQPGGPRWRSLLQLQPWATLVRTGIWLYLGFHALWGFNYYRTGSQTLLQLAPAAYSGTQADTLVQYLQQQLHTICADSAALEQAKTKDYQKLSAQAVAAYNKASATYPFLAFSKPSLKPILLGRLQAYFGYAGYIFPFTGEAQVDFYVPAFTLPFTVCHEMAHQQGFGTESEANLIGFLAASKAHDVHFRYSAYAAMHQYALRALYAHDSTRALQYAAQLPGILQKDRKELYAFYAAHESFVQPLLDGIYTSYLQSNNQPEGLQSYNRVVAWLIAYAGKYGWESL